MRIVPRSPWRPLCKTCETRRGWPENGRTTPTKVCSGEAGWTARLLDSNEPYVDEQRLREEDRLDNGDWSRQHPSHFHSGPGSRVVAERAVLDVRRISRVSARVLRRRGSWK